MPETTSPGQRFMQLIQQLGLSKNAFAQSLGKTATVIQHLVDERNKPGFDLLNRVLEVYPNVSSDWLLLGQGPMLRDENLAQLFAETTSAEPSPVPGGIDLNDVPDAPRRRQGNLLQSADIAATLRLASPPRNGTSNGHLALATAKQPLAAEAAKPITPANVDEPVPPLAAPVPAAVAAAAPAAPSVPGAVPTSPALPDPAYMASLFQTQQLQHQLALAEQRNQHLLEQQALLQQMVQLLQRAV
jgi:plasmid maintenance system antidote protein VapI